MSSYVYCCMVMTKIMEAERTTEEEHVADPNHWVGSEDPISRVFECRGSRSGDVVSLSAYNPTTSSYVQMVPPSHRAPCLLCVGLLAA